MSHGPRIVPLDTWLEQHLQEIISATTKSAFEAAFNAAISKNVSITLNGKHISRSEYMQHIWDDETHERTGTVTFKGVVAVPNDTNATVETGEIGAFYQVKYNVAHVLSPRIVTSSLNVVVAHENRPHDAPPEFDGRVVTSMNQVATEQAGESREIH